MSNTQNSTEIKSGDVVRIARPMMSKGIVIYVHRNEACVEAFGLGQRMVALSALKVVPA